MPTMCLNLNNSTYHELWWAAIGDDTRYGKKVEMVNIHHYSICATFDLVRQNFKKQIPWVS